MLALIVKGDTEGGMGRKTESETTTTTNIDNSTNINANPDNHTVRNIVSRID